MKVIIFGATGMVGQGVLKECLRDTDVLAILTVGRNPREQTYAKLREIAHKDFTDFSPIEKELKGYDACFFCLGVSSVGMGEEDYRHITYDFTMAAASILARLNPQMTFIYVSGAGTDSTEKGKMMWARVKGATENAILKLPFKAAYMFRPGAIQPMDGIAPRNKGLRIALALLGWLFPLLRKLFPKSVTTTRILGRAMINITRNGYSKNLIEAWDINEIGSKG